MTLARQAAVLGSPIEHSLSPVLHLAAYRSLGLVGWTYRAVEVSTHSGLADFVGACDGSWAGLSLTMPLKRWVQPLLTAQSELATATGVVNTVVLDGVGGRVGHNTDVHGIVEALRERGVRDLSSAVVLGGGATACSAVAALAHLGCRRPQVVVRSPERAADLVAAGRALGLDVVLAGWAQAGPLLAAAQVVVSTVPAPAHDEVRRLLEGTSVPGLMLDVTYHPWPSVLATSWQGAGGTALGGFTMLVHQAAEQVRLMTGREPDDAAMRAAGETELAGR
ncbi:shikimate dehydrogenase [Angustibacter sp. McL0619]|uniref:shikimate dehydrogenase n=1 Tax=Angustibacter sp. McL0619 TaxID=3415676 RepID=UPI003CF9D562